jgi:hypothetical protein
MGNCYESQINPIDLLQNELEVSEFLRQEKYLIKKIISRSFKKNQELIDSTNLPKNFKVIPKLRAILDKLDGSFSELVFYEIVIHLESRFKKEKYNNFEEVKKRLKMFYHNNFFNTEYNSLMLNSEEFNEFLDKEKVPKIRRKNTKIK